MKICKDNNKRKHKRKQQRIKKIKPILIMIHKTTHKKLIKYRIKNLIRALKIMRK